MIVEYEKQTYTNEKKFLKIFLTDADAEHYLQILLNSP